MEPKSCANPVLRLCLLFEFDKRWFPLERAPVQEACSLDFFHQMPRLCSWHFRKTHPRSAPTCVLAFFLRPPHTRGWIDVRSSAFDFGGFLAIDRLNFFGRVSRMCWKALGEQQKIKFSAKLGRWNPGLHHHFVFSRLGLAFTASAVHCLGRSQISRTRTSPWSRKAQICSHPRKGCMPSKTRPTMLAFALWDSSGSLPWGRGQCYPLVGLELMLPLKLQNVSVQISMALLWPDVLHCSFLLRSWMASLWLWKSLWQSR